MQLLTKETDFIGTSTAGRDTANLTAFLTSAREIRLKLGAKSALLDEYLTTLFTTLSEQIGFVTSKDGFDAMCDLTLMCQDTAADASLVFHPFFAKAKTYTDAHPLPCYDDQIRPAIYATLLSGDFLKTASERYEAKLKTQLTAVLDTTALGALANKICKSLGFGGKKKLQTLQIQFSKRFLLAPAMTLFSEGATNQLLYLLTLRDRETNQSVLQILMELEPQNS